MKNMYAEKTALPKFVFVVYGVQFIIVSIYLFQQEKSKLSLYFVLGMILVGLLLLLIQLSIKINEEGVSYRINPFNSKKIDWGEIKSFKIQKTDALSNFAGWGVRYSKDYGWAYITSTEYAIFITKNDSKRIVLSLKNKEELNNYLVQKNISF